MCKFIQPKSLDSADDDVDSAGSLPIALPLMTACIGRRRGIVLAFSFRKQR